MKIISKKLSGSALLISLLILTGIFIIAFGAGYLSFFNTKNTDIYQQSAKARLASETGVERMKWEVAVNNFDIYTGCGSRILETNLDDGYYYLKCTLNFDDLPKIQAVGVYKNTSVTLDTGFCYDIDVECSDFCSIGSLCGGGVLFSTNPLIISAPSGCTGSDGSGCNNSFLTEDTLKIIWDSGTPKVQTNATSTSDGRDNMVLLLGAGRYLAAEYCGLLDVNGFSDWYLPAIDEAYYLMTNSNCCENPGLCLRGSNSSPVVGGFVATDIYYTSNEYIADINYSWSQSFVDGTQNPKGKEEALYVRCIRRP